MKKVDSDNLSSIHYTPETKLLEITFNNGRIYHYHNVPAHTYQSFERATSHGKHFREHIKKNFKGIKK